MGAQGSIEKNLSDYKNSERMGVYRQFEENDRNLIEISHRMPSEATFKQWAAEVEEIKNKNQLSQSIYLPEKSYFKPTGLCGSSGTLHIIFERWESFLREEVASRRKNQHHYTQEELWFILFSLSKLGVIYEALGTKVGDIHPNNIVVTAEGFLRLVNRHSVPGQPTNFERVIEEYNADVYLAPQQMDQNLIERGIYDCKSPEKADTFSLGITMLEVSTLENCSYLYIRNPLRISLDKMETYKKYFKEKYSTSFFKTVMSMIEVNPKNRIKMSQIYETLKPHAANIEELRFFSLTQNGLKESQAYSVVPGEGSECMSKSRAQLEHRLNPQAPSKMTTVSFKNKF